MGMTDSEEQFYDEVALDPAKYKANLGVAALTSTSARDVLMYVRVCCPQPTDVVARRHKRT